MDGIDKLNNIETQEREVTDIETYFDGMHLTPKQIKERVDFAEDTEDIIFFMFAYFIAQYEHDAINISSLRREFESQYREVIEKYVDITPRVEAYIARFVDEVTNTTLTKIDAQLAKDNADKMDILANTYWLSESRAADMAVNMALDVINYKDNETAKARGFTRKQWIAIEDDVTRLTHSMVNTRIIPIDEYFEVSAARLLYAHDTISEGSTGMDHPEEIVNCRCWCVYLR